MGVGTCGGTVLQNVAGLAEDEVDNFIDPVSDHYPWDVLMLQEGFRRSEGIALASNHLLFTSGQISGGLRCPALLVHGRWARDDSGFVKFAGSGTRWVAVELNAKYIFVSLHLPHRKISTETYAETLAEVTTLLRAHAGKTAIIGMDANVSVEGIVDYVQVGESVQSSAHWPGKEDRTQLLHEFLCSHGLTLTNTFMDAEGDGLSTRTNWSGFGSAQVDFIAAPLTLPCEMVEVDQSMEFSADHRMVFANYSIHQPREPTHCRPSVKDWKPDETWASAAEDIHWNFMDWHEFAPV